MGVLPVHKLQMMMATIRKVTSGNEPSIPIQIDKQTDGIGKKERY